MKANNKGIVNKYLYSLCTSCIDGIQAIGTVSCLVLWKVQKSEN